MPEGVTAEIKDNEFVVSSGEKKLKQSMSPDIRITISGSEILVEMANDSKSAREKHGLFAKLVANMVTGVNAGFTKELTFTGTGYRASVNGSEIVLAMGYSHDIKLAIPSDLEVKVVKNSILVSGISKANVGQFAAIIREVRPPEVYKGKGIKYKEEHIRRKAGKTAASK